MKKFVIILMSLICLSIGLFAIKEAILIVLKDTVLGNVECMVYLIGIALYVIFCGIPTLTYWNKYWEEKLK